jgi:opacity protein-like surface antigen
MGVELGYNGGLIDIDTPAPGGLRDGADVVRNAGQVAVVGDVPIGDFSPYALAGIGIDNFNVRTEEGTAFEDDTSGYVPAGLGLRYHITDVISADARVSYNIPFAQDFAPFDTGVGSGRLQGLLQIGGSY